MLLLVLEELLRGCSGSVVEEDDLHEPAGTMPLLDRLRLHNRSRRYRRRRFLLLGLSALLSAMNLRAEMILAAPLLGAAFLLQRINELTNGKSMRANLALLLNNARLAARIARAWRTSELRKII